MRLRKAPYIDFKRVSTSLDDFSYMRSSPVFMLNNIPVMDLEMKKNDLISFMNPMCPNCGSKNVVRNGTCIRKREKGVILRLQRYISNDCRYSFVAWSSSYRFNKIIF